MRYIITILFFFYCAASFGQTPQPTGQPSKFNNQYYKFNAYIEADSGVFIPRRDTSWIPIKQELHFNPSDSLLYFWNLHKWVQVGYGSVPVGSFVRYTDSLTKYITPTQLKDSLGNYVTLHTYQVVNAPKTWQHTHIFSDSVGIGGAPTQIFQVTHGEGRLIFDGQRLTLYDNADSNNVLVGKQTGLSATSNVVAIGSIALKNAVASNSIGIGFGALASNGTANRDVAVGSLSQTLTNGSYNTSIGDGSAITMFGDSDVAVGYSASTATSINIANIDNSEIVLGTNTYSGATTATFISSNSLVVGERYPVLITFLATIPNPFLTSTTYANATVSNSNTLQFNINLFTSKGTGQTQLNLFNKQTNSIAIGANAASDSSNQILFGNSANTVLKANKLAIDINSTPQNGDVYIYNSSIGKFEPTTTSTIPSRMKAMTTTQRDALASPQQGWIILNTTSGVGQMYQGSTWHDLW